MFRGNADDKNNIDFLLNSDAVRYCIDYFNQHELINYPPGQYGTDRDDVKLRIDEYETQIADERYWQSHRCHIDVYILLRGTERIDVRPESTLKSYHYDRHDDIVMLEDGMPRSINYMTKYGDMLVLVPGEAHKTGIHVELANVFKVALFKIRV